MRRRLDPGAASSSGDPRPSFVLEIFAEHS
jgi:hypothetical protein